MPQAVVDRIKVIDADTHVSEPPDLWTSRVSNKWGELVPHVVFDDERKEEVWYFGGSRYHPTAGAAMAGWREFPPAHPPSLDEADRASWDSVARLQRMDEYGIHAQVIYPNVGGFGSGRFLQLGEPELMLECVQAYNDFLIDWIQPNPERFVPIMALPFWDVEAATREIQRCHKKGHKGILFGSEPHIFGQPHLADPHWNPIWETAQELGLTINFHIASGDMTQLFGSGYPGNGRQANYAKTTVMFFLDNARAVMEVIISGICHRYPRLNFVSVESGVGWVPFVLEALDWQWLNSGCQQEHPEMDLLPSEYFKRQVYACFWFERGSAEKAIELVGADNLLYETDFPHPTSMSPGPASFADNPKDFIEQNLSKLPEDVLRKILHDNAARLYHLS
ncbi:MAG TPA: amidohydrolase family protein [Dehalococcoidia bacterium]|nr:amidohydrolase family protein [Dehalococcoidia bacterium]